MVNNIDTKEIDSLDKIRSIPVIQKLAGMFFSKTGIERKEELSNVLMNNDKKTINGNELNSVKSVDLSAGQNNFFYSYKYIIDAFSESFSELNELHKNECLDLFVKNIDKIYKKIINSNLTNQEDFNEIVNEISSNIKDNKSNKNFNLNINTEAYLEEDQIIDKTSYSLKNIYKFLTDANNKENKNISKFENSNLLNLCYEYCKENCSRIDGRFIIRNDDKNNKKIKQIINNELFSKFVRNLRNNNNNLFNLNKNEIRLNKISLIKDCKELLDCKRQNINLNFSLFSKIFNPKDGKQLKCMFDEFARQNKAFSNIYYKNNGLLEQIKNGKLIFTVDKDNNFELISLSNNQQKIIDDNEVKPITKISKDKEKNYYFNI